MAWTFYELRFRLLSPLHIGHQKIGNIQRTRRYVPARTLWGAVTARLTRMMHPRAEARDYEVIGSQVAEQIAFTYLFPTDEQGAALYPRYANGVCRYGAERISDEEFTWRYLGSYAATALNYERNAAEDASLHEVEFIAPYTRGGLNQDGIQPQVSLPVHLFGYAIVAEGCHLPWQEALQEIQVGGERRYGWGRLRLLAGGDQPIGTSEARLFDLTQCEAKSGARPQVTLQGGDALLAHAAVGASNNIAGDVEPLAGRVWERNRGAGQQLQFTQVCYVPGAQVKEKQNLMVEQSFAMTDAHIWQALPPTAD